MQEIILETIRDIQSKTGLSFKHMKKGPTVIFIEKKQFALSVKNDQLHVKKLKKLFAKEYRYDLSEFT